MDLAAQVKTSGLTSNDENKVPVTGSKNSITGRKNLVVEQTVITHILHRPSYTYRIPAALASFEIDEDVCTKPHLVECLKKFTYKNDEEIEFVAGILIKLREKYGSGCRGTFDLGVEIETVWPLFFASYQGGKNDIMYDKGFGMASEFYDILGNLVAVDPKIKCLVDQNCFYGGVLMEGSQLELDMFKQLGFCNMFNEVSISSYKTYEKNKMFLVASYDSESG
jgi:hypothetical protein